MGFKWKKHPEQIFNSNVAGNGRVPMFIATTWEKLVFPFVPARDGFLSDKNVFVISRNEREAVIRYNSVYARRQYFGKDHNFSKSKHRKATHHWHEAAEKAGRFKTLIRDLQAYLKRG